VALAAATGEEVPIGLAAHPAHHHLVMRITFCLYRGDRAREWAITQKMVKRITK